MTHARRASKARKELARNLSGVTTGTPSCPKEVLAINLAVHYTANLKVALIVKQTYDEGEGFPRRLNTAYQPNTHTMSEQTEEYQQLINAAYGKLLWRSLAAGAEHLSWSIAQEVLASFPDVPPLQIVKELWYAGRLTVHWKDNTPVTVSVGFEALKTASKQTDGGTDWIRRLKLNIINQANPTLPSVVRDTHISRELQTAASMRLIFELHKDSLRAKVVLPPNAHDDFANYKVCLEGCPT